METKVLKLLAKVKNPKSGRDLIDEGRIKQVDATDNAVTVRYDREGFSPFEKKRVRRSDPFYFR